MSFHDAYMKFFVCPQCPGLQFCKFGQLHVNGKFFVPNTQPASVVRELIDRGIDMSRVHHIEYVGSWPYAVYKQRDSWFEFLFIRLPDDRIPVEPSTSVPKSGFKLTFMIVSITMVSAGDAITRANLNTALRQLRNLLNELASKIRLGDFPMEIQETVDEMLFRRSKYEPLDPDLFLD